MKDEALQRRLLSEDELTPAQAEKMVIAGECANHDAVEIRTTSKDVSQVHSAAKDRPGKSTPAKRFMRLTPKQAVTFCYRCNIAHRSEDCHLKNTTCHFCGRKGHIVQGCLQKNAKK